MAFTLATGLRRLLTRDKAWEGPLFLVLFQTQAPTLADSILRLCSTL